MADHASRASPFDPAKRYTWADCKRHPEFTRLELIDGRVVMSPSPKRSHQTVLNRLFAALLAFLDGDVEKIYLAPMDVFLQPGMTDEAATRVVQPDLLVVLDPEKLAEDGIRGAPDFVVEVMPESSARKDLLEKRRLYEEAGVGEYWVVDPDEARVFAWSRSPGGERFGNVVEYARGEPVASAVLVGFSWTPE
ncbi:MAG: Uma2 family endonuclease [Spirochaetales bacterium]|nr:Uma2 family endonuclease [Spirochaetales bacterium]